ncbi:MAG: N-acetyltransferase [Candidatus Viridilinea halotolerans]|uniref:N-acetyltransferase n=1 Tax=Candidatus Viridilinea halotolerans TaxID=2491704 RepID=A0A426U4U4_9CHLR|nr:MAG: N-acetyltransferase [Candidatus Viridilinea halotolerans]
MTSPLYQPPVSLPRLQANPDAQVLIRRARVSDIPRLYEIINYYAARGDMLPKTLDQLYNKVRAFNVAEAADEVVGCASLHITWADLGEIVSLAVHPDFQGRSLGRQMVEPLFVEARELGINTVFALTLQVGFFSRLGFREVPKLHLPHKIWQDCATCFKQDRCDEVAMMRQV